jgi:hypothetical protein
MTIHHLARHAGRHGTLVCGLVGIAIEGMARSIGIGSNPEFPPTKEQIERLIAELDALPPRCTLSECLEAERYYGLACYQDIYWGNNALFFEGTLVEMMYPIMSWTLDINILLERANKVYDVLTSKSMTVDGSELEEILQPKRSWNPIPLFFKRSRTNRFADSMAALLVPAMQAAREAWRRLECCENMQRLTLALLL